MSRTAFANSAWRRRRSPWENQRVEFYRAELVRQRDLSKDSWGYLLPFVPGVALALFGGGFEDRPTSQPIALVAFGVVLFLGIAWWNAHMARRLQNEIDALDAS